MKKTKELMCHTCGGRGYLSYCETGNYENGVGWGKAWSESCNECNGKGVIEVPMTNADHIRSMNDEELADFLYEYFMNGYGCHNFLNPITKYNEIYYWLVDEVTE